MPRGTAPAAEPLLYRFLIYETHDEGRTLELLGERKARDRDAALRAYLGEPVREAAGTFVAINENHMRLKTVTVRPRFSFGDADAPSTEDEPAEAEAEPAGEPAAVPPSGEIVAPAAEEPGGRQESLA